MGTPRSPRTHTNHVTMLRGRSFLRSEQDGSSRRALQSMSRCRSFVRRESSLEHDSTKRVHPNVPALKAARSLSQLEALASHVERVAPHRQLSSHEAYVERVRSLHNQSYVDAPAPPSRAPLFKRVSSEL